MALEGITGGGKNHTGKDNPHIITKRYGAAWLQQLVAHTPVTVGVVGIGSAATIITIRMLVLVAK